MDGFTATRRIRQVERKDCLKRVPILGLTADVRPQTRTDVFRAGGDGLIPKPFKQKELIKMLDKWLPSEDQKGQSLVSEDELSGASFFNLPSGVLIDEAVILELKTVLAEDFLLLVDAFFEDADRITESFYKILSHEVALDYTALFQLSHSLKSVSQSMGAMRLSSMVGQLEQESRQKAVPELTEKLHEISMTYQNTKNELQRVVASL
ncbi:Hpt domain-containing protein [Marinomonas sp. IMCC 4694]|uniref:Hpt domain-containing protein n=1 Tax=Marinomonas sp. IMCC 4694 TaxID=2605432 RepID=UPI0011E795BF|nr:Hpt domain-containing protein [Marinomonas sp. IMCC 4694]TYL47963.1 response regulator [Marinomonas sp. IMCC 4694]